MAIRRLLITTVTSLLLVLPASAVVAQDESPAPDPLAALADSPFAGVFPTELGGLPWDDITIAVGQENLEGQDEEELTETETLLEGLGATIDDLTTVSASRINEDFTEFTFLVAYQVSGVDADPLLETIILSFADDLDEPRRESGEVAGKDVILLWDDVSPDADPFYVYAAGDTVWLVVAVEPDLTEAFEKLP